MLDIIAVMDDEIHSHSIYNSVTVLPSFKILGCSLLGLQSCQFIVGRCGDKLGVVFVVSVFGSSVFLVTRFVMVGRFTT
jgi:hypothetical protein